MISRESFKKILIAIQNQYAREEEFTQLLQKFFDGSMVSEISSDFLATILSVLQEEFEDKDDTIYWWLFDAPNAGKNKASCKVECNDGTFYLYDMDGLYDFLKFIKEKKQDNHA